MQFEKGELITVTKMVDGGWWEGMCNGNVGWFPGNYVEEHSTDTAHIHLHVQLYVYTYVYTHVHVYTYVCIPYCICIYINLTL